MMQMSQWLGETLNRIGSEIRVAFSGPHVGHNAIGNFTFPLDANELRLRIVSMRVAVTTTADELERVADRWEEGDRQDALLDMKERANRIEREAQNELNVFVRNDK